MRRRWARFATILALVVALSLVSGYFIVSSLLYRPSQNHIDVSWAAYQTLSSLKGNSTAIIVGNVTGINGTISGGIPYTDFSVAVEQSIKGSLTPKSTVIVRQLGNATTIVEGEHLMTIGQQAVLFLTNAQSPNVKYIVGGPQGRFIVQNGTASSLDAIYSDDGWIHVKAHAVPLSQFVQEVQS
jgi:hypothetical protein